MYIGIKSFKKALFEEVFVAPGAECWGELSDEITSEIALAHADCMTIDAILATPDDQRPGGPLAPSQKLDLLQTSHIARQKMIFLLVMRVGADELFKAGASFEVSEAEMMRALNVGKDALSTGHSFSSDIEVDELRCGYFKRLTKVKAKQINEEILEEVLLGTNAENWDQFAKTSTAEYERALLEHAKLNSEIIRIISNPPLSFQQQQRLEQQMQRLHDLEYKQDRLFMISLGSDVLSYTKNAKEFGINISTVIEADFYGQIVLIAQKISVDNALQEAGAISSFDANGKTSEAKLEPKEYTSNPTEDVLADLRFGRCFFPEAEIVIDVLKARFPPMPETSYDAVLKYLTPPEETPEGFYRRNILPTRGNG